MQNSSILALMFLSLASGTALADDDPVPNPPIPVDVRDVFVPVGFDNNDEVEVVLDGYLPDTCYKLAFSRVTFDQATHRYTVRQYARKMPGICFETPVPFTTEAPLGLIKAGAYDVTSRGADQQPLDVAVATQDGTDDHLYAPVDTVRVERVVGGTGLQAVIEGRFTSSCMRFEELRLIDTGRTLQLLPIIRLMSQADCRIQERPFLEKIKLPTTMTSGRHLLHVRSLNGKAQNAVFSVD